VDIDAVKIKEERNKTDEIMIVIFCDVTSNENTRITLLSSQKTTIFAAMGNSVLIGKQVACITKQLSYLPDLRAEVLSLLH
jgi:hypothetical protein